MPAGKGLLGFVQDCGYDMAGAIFTHLLGPLRPRVPFAPAHVHKLRQSDFFPAPPAGGENYTATEMAMSDAAYLYVPGGCGSAGTRGSRQACRIHVM